MRCTVSTASTPICAAAFRLSCTWSVRDTVVLSQQIATGTPASRKRWMGCGEPRRMAPVW